MSSALAASTPAHSAESYPSSICLFSWMIVQSGALALGAMRIPLWARAPGAIEFFSPQILLIIQILMAALLFPALTAGWRAALLAIATSWPFTLLASLLGARSLNLILLSGAFVSGWLVVLLVWRAICRGPRSQMTMSGIATIWASSGPILPFLRTEYARAVPQLPTSLNPAILGPITNGLIVIDPTVSAAKSGAWLSLLACGVIGCGILWAKKTWLHQTEQPAQTLG